MAYEGEELRQQLALRIKQEAWLRKLKQAKDYALNTCLLGSTNKGKAINTWLQSARFQTNYLRNRYVPMMAVPDLNKPDGLRTYHWMYENSYFTTDAKTYIFPKPPRTEQFLDQFNLEPFVRARKTKKNKMYCLPSDNILSH